MMEGQKLYQQVYGRQLETKKVTELYQKLLRNSNKCTLTDNGNAFFLPAKVTNANKHQQSAQLHFTGALTDDSGDDNVYIKTGNDSRWYPIFAPGELGNSGINLSTDIDGQKTCDSPQL